MHQKNQNDNANAWRSRFLNLHQKHVAPYGIISTSPIILHIPLFDSPLNSFKKSYEVLFSSLQNQKIYILCNWGCFAESIEIIKQAAYLQKIYVNKYKLFRFIHLCNTKSQLAMFKKAGLEGVFCNQNCFVDEELFYPQPSRVKKFNALYDARLSFWKRHYLAEKIDKLALIFYFLPADDSDYTSKIIKDFQGKAYFFNVNENNEYKRLNTSEINQAINSCKVGLCLSEEEGAMFASIQYLLCGLPIINTPSRGGREVFFDDDYVLTVEPDANLVKDGVIALIQKQISPEFIRQRTLQKIQKHRKRFINLVQSIYEKEGKNRFFADEWKDIFFNRLIKNQNHFEIIELLKSH